MLLLMVVPVKANTKENVTLTKCVDGDTAHFNINGKDEKVRFLAINAPEYTKEKEPYGKEASEKMCALLTDANNITLEYDDESDKTDKYGRILAWVYADDVLTQAEMLKEGLAEVKYIYGDYAYVDELKALEAEAKKQKLNMWSGVEPAKDNKVSYYIGAVGGVLLVIGAFFMKGKRNQKRMIREGIRRIKR